MNKPLSIIGVFGFILLIGILFNANQSGKATLKLKDSIIEKKDKEIEFFVKEVKTVNAKSQEKDIIIDSLYRELEAKPKEVIKYTTVEKKEYFEKHFVDSTQIIQLNEERLVLVEIAEAQNQQITLLKTNIDNLESIISRQSDIMQAQEITISAQQKDIKRLKFQNTVIKIGAGVIVVLAIL